ncbi:MAG TPA: hypothetical protein VLF87_00285 [Patescibacteria group bacterium]|nr:hypothetical protein [Patescibacteria group bacterium]
MATYNFEHLEASLETPIYEDAISNRQRRSLQRQSSRDRLATARDAQATSGVPIRIARSVKNQTDFLPELKIWIPYGHAHTAKRKSLGNLAMTIFDTSQQPLRSSEGQTLESVEALFDARYPDLLRPSPPIEVAGIGLYGIKDCPFIGLQLAPGFSEREQETVRQLIAPELALDASHQKIHRMHISLGQALSRECAVVLLEELEPVLPTYVQLLPASITVAGQSN